MTSILNTFLVTLTKIFIESPYGTYLCVVLVIVLLLEIITVKNKLNDEIKRIREGKEDENDKKSSKFNKPIKERYFEEKKEN